MFRYIPLVSRKVSAASREELEHHVPAAQQDLTQEENAAQRRNIGKGGLPYQASLFEE